MQRGSPIKDTQNKSPASLSEEGESKSQVHVYSHNRALCLSAAMSGAILHPRVFCRSSACLCIPGNTTHVSGNTPHPHPDGSNAQPACGGACAAHNYGLRLTSTLKRVQTAQGVRRRLRRLCVRASLTSSRPRIRRSKSSLLPRPASTRRLVRFMTSVYSSAFVAGCDFCFCRMLVARPHRAQPKTRTLARVRKPICVPCNRAGHGARLCTRRSRDADPRAHALSATAPGLTPGISPRSHVGITHLSTASFARLCLRRAAQARVLCISCAAAPSSGRTRSFTSRVCRTRAACGRSARASRCED
jgi:hypothetical protein